MSAGWVKLHRQVMTNEIFRHDRTAWHIFQVLLLVCDKKTGKWSGGRFQLADLCNENPATTYKALKRLEKAKMVTLSSNNKYTTIYICKWKDFQDTGNTSSNNKVTTGEQLGNTLTRIENKNKEVLLRNTAYGKPEINDMFNYWNEKVGYEITSRRQANRNACNNMYKKYGKEKLEQLIVGVSKAQEDRYAPRIGDFVELQGNLNKLLAWGKAQQTSQIKSFGGKK